jgi:hypothetical protein
MSSVFKDKDYISVADVRAASGLRDFKPGICTCLYCQKEFKSPDVRSIRKCPTCKWVGSERPSSSDSEHLLPRVNSKDISQVVKCPFPPVRGGFRNYVEEKSEDDIYLK